MTDKTTDKEDASLWGPTLEKSFIDIMVDEVNKGNMKSGQFGSKTWAKILEEIQCKSSRNYSKNQVKQKYNRLPTKYRLFFELLKQTGFGWDPETNTATEDTWQNYLRRHPKASMFRTKGCDHYILLELIFNKSTATGLFQRAAASGPPDTDEERELENEASRKETHDTDDVTSYTSLLPSSSVERRPKKLRAEQMNEAILAWIEAAKAKTDASLARAERYKRGTSAEPRSQIEDFSLTKCVHIIEGMEEIEDDVYVKALEKFKDPDWREMFVSMSSLRKRAWLDRL